MNEHEDAFASIAKKMAFRNKDLVEIKPEKLSKKCVSSKADFTASFIPANKIDNFKKLNSTMDKARRKYSKFLHNFVPKLKLERPKFELKKFKYREENADDEKNFKNVLNLKGNWELVTLPHYGGPEGKKTIFYHAHFVLPKELIALPKLYLCFGGVDYSCEVYINGLFAGANEGFFMPFEFDVTNLIKHSENILVIKVMNDIPPIGDTGAYKLTFGGDKLYAATGLGWDDAERGWHHCPPGMGIYDKVYFEGRENVFLTDIFVIPNIKEKEIEVRIELFNSCKIPQSASMQLSLYGRNFEDTIYENNPLDVNPLIGLYHNQYRFNFKVPKMRLWELESPHLYQIQVTINGNDAKECTFGMREFKFDSDKKPFGNYYLNDKKLRLFGANTMGFEQQNVMNRNFEQLRDDILLTKICNMNFWRLTQRPVQKEVYDMCDQLGLLVQTDYPLFGIVPRSKCSEIIRQAAEMSKIIRNHPCNSVVSYINEPFPNAKNKPNRYLLRIEMEQLFAAMTANIKIINPAQVIKFVDGDYDPPSSVGLPDNHCYCMWYNGHGVDFGKLHKGYWMTIKKDWNFGCGEFGVEGLDFLDLMQRRYPDKWLQFPDGKEENWRPDQIIDAQTGKFHFMFFDTPQTLADWVNKSQQYQAVAIKFMTAALRRNKRMVSCAIHLFIDAWPAGWMKAIMDCERKPKPAYFAYLDALTPLKCDIRCDRFAYFAGENMSFELRLLNDSTQKNLSKYSFHYQIETEDEIIFANAKPLIKGAYQGIFEFEAPEFEDEKFLTIRVGLIDKNKKTIHDDAVDVKIYPKIENTDINLSNFINYDEYITNKETIDYSVANGKKVVFNPLTKGLYKIGNEDVTIFSCEMGAVHFVSRALQHHLMKNFQEEDFRYWHDDNLGYITPIADTYFEHNKFTSILSTGAGGWKSTVWHKASVVGEMNYGKGKFIICNLLLKNHLKTNPSALLFAQKLINYIEE